MIIIKNIRIERFRSCRKTEIIDLSDFNVLCGKNNSGKSNILRAINLFFTNTIEPNVHFNINSDCSSKAHEKRRLTISIKFGLDSRINIRGTLKDVLIKIPSDSEITKIYDYNPSVQGGYSISYRLNDELVDKKDEYCVDQFLSLFNFRYITASRSPSAVLEENLDELRSELQFRINHKRRNPSLSVSANIQEEAFNLIRSLADKLFEPIKTEVAKADRNIRSIAITTPENIVELIQNASYKIQTADGKIFSERLQGQGIQNLLLFAVLHLIDKNFHRKFGWKIATIWAIEEPEVSFHYDLENQLANYLLSNATNSSERFQVIATSHSNVFPQYASGHFLIQQVVEDAGSNTISKKYPLHEFVNKLSEAKITGLVPLVALYPHKKIVLVEGYIDEVIISNYLKHKNARDIVIYAIENYLNDPKEKGESALYDFLKVNSQLLSKRINNQGIIAIFDWDTDRNKVNKLSKKIISPNEVWQWDESKVNPKLDKSFRGIERFYDTQIIEELLGGEALVNDRGAACVKDRYYADQARYEKVKHELFERAKANLKYTYFKCLDVLFKL